MPKIYNALQLKNGAKADYNKMGTITQPVQFLPNKDKNDEWAAWNVDWLELQGLKQLRRNARRLLKNYKLANGIIDKTDYMVEDDNEQAELIDILTRQDESALELKFYPIIPNVVNVMVGEFAKRADRIMYRAVDDLSYNEMMEEKRAMVEDHLIAYAEQKLIQNMIAQGADPNDPELQQQMQQQIKSLPEIQQFFTKSYRSMYEQWATHQHKVDEERFFMKELETTGFRDMLTTDREFWHFRMLEDDYEVELWNPVLTFYHKSPDVRYVSQGNWVGKIELITLSDIIDKYGYMMTDEQLEALEHIYPVKSAGYPILGQQNDGTFYDATRSHEWNTNMPSLGMRQFMSVTDNFLSMGDDLITQITSQSEDLIDYGTYQMLRVTTVYWKSQRMVGHLTKITEDGMIIQEVVTEEYKITEKPIYNTSLNKNKTAETLVFGEHIEWIWINQVWSGIKIGPNRPSFYGSADVNGVQPIYLNIKPVPFQFKGDFTLYGCKLPVEGSVFSDRNSKSVSLVDKMKPYQIGYNMVNNQIADILIDELGTVIMMDQNALPKHSMGEDWGRGNFAKAYVAMKDFQMLPLDTSITNTENALNFQHYQVLNLEQSQRLMSRIQLANYFKQQAFETIGISPQRMGAVNAQETATGVQQAINQSYSQTEMYFVQHSEYLMPRVHQMRTDLAQYYQSKRPSVRLQYMTTMDERVNFQINGTDLLARDFNIFCTTKVNTRQVMDSIRQLAMSNNTSGASIYDLGNLIKAESMAEITHVLKEVEEKVQGQQQQAQESAKQIEEMRQQAESERQQQKLQWDAEQKALDRQNAVDVAEVRSAGFGAMKDLDNNQQNDYMDSLEVLDKKRKDQQELNLRREDSIMRQNSDMQKNQLKREELQIRREIADKQVQVARENKNRYDKKSSKD
jgi:hypothetical protein